MPLLYLVYKNLTRNKLRTLLPGAAGSAGGVTAVTDRSVRFSAAVATTLVVFVATVNGVLCHAGSTQSNSVSRQP